MREHHSFQDEYTITDTESNVVTAGLIKEQHGRLQTGGRQGKMMG